MKLQLTLLTILFSISLGAQNPDLAINEVIVSSSEVEFKNIGRSQVSIIGLRIQSGRQSMTVTDATSLSCGDYFLSPGEIVVIPLSFNLTPLAGELYVNLSGQVPTAYVQWSSTGSFASKAQANGLWNDTSDFASPLKSGNSLELVDIDTRVSSDGWLRQDTPTTCEENTQCKIAKAEMRKLSCNDNDTPTDGTDDYFEFAISVDGVNLTEVLKLSIEGYKLEPSSVRRLCRDCIVKAYRTSEYNGSESLELEITTDNDECSYTIDFESPESCSTECDMQATQFIFLDCKDNGTDGDPSDDYIEFIVRPFGFNLSEEYYLEFSNGPMIGPLPNSAPYEIISSQGWYTPGDGDFTVNVIDGDDPSCTELITVEDRDHCSPNCFLTIDSLGIYCDDAGTPYDDSDDFYRTDVQVSTTVSASDGYQLSYDPFVASPSLLNFGQLYSFTSDPGSTAILNAFSLTIHDPAFPSCAGLTLHGTLDQSCLATCKVEAAEIALAEGNDICIETDGESVYTFEITNDTSPDSIRLLALDPFDDIVFITDKLSFDAHQLGTGTFKFILVNYLALSGAELSADIERLMGCFALSSPFVLNIDVQDNCTTNTKEVKYTDDVFPNPVTETVCWNAISEVKKVELFDTRGRRMDYTTTSVCMDLSDISPGVYYLQFVLNGGDMKTKKIVKF